MNFEVVVIGGGIGGLTAAALLAARGLNVCLFERQSQPGGCIGKVEHQGFQFEPTFGLYDGWEAGGIYDRVFSELPVHSPKVHTVTPSYTVRLPDGLDVPVVTDPDRFQDYLRAAFPECAEAAVDFYRAVSLGTSASFSSQLNRCSSRFRRFVDVQLQTLLQCSSNDCPLDLAAQALNPRRGCWRLEGGAQSLADALTRSVKASGGQVRLNAPVLRLAYGSDGSPLGIDLLSGERVTATRAIVSNLTVWDTYGKLIGLQKTPPSISSQLRRAQGWGCYLLFLTMERTALQRLPSDRLLALSDWQENQAYDPESTQFMFYVPSHAEPGPGEKLPVTVSTYTKAEDWFSFHEDHAAHEEQDQAMLESLWSRLHTAMPELGDSVEIIESATPQTFYETTRRRFGMIGRPVTGHIEPPPFSNLFLVGDTVAGGAGLSGTVEGALRVADKICPLNSNR
jgi:phytoene dehydrogenase-like protein